MKRTDPQSVYTFLRELDIPFKSLEHEPVMTMEDCEAIGLELEAPFCKNLFLSNRQSTEFFLFLITKDRRFRTSEVSKMINRPRLSFGDHNRLEEFLGIKPGAISPMGLIHDHNHRVTLLMDRELIGLPRFCVHPCINTQSLVLSMSDFLEKFLPGTGHHPQYLNLSP